MTRQVSKDKLIEELAKSVGIEAAKQIVEDTMKKLGITGDTLSKEDALKVCRALTERNDVVSIAARVLLAKIYINSI